MINALPHSDNKEVEEVHFNMALSSIGDKGALCHKEKMSEKEVPKKEQEKHFQYKFEFEEDYNLEEDQVAPI